MQSFPWTGLQTVGAKQRKQRAETRKLVNVPEYGRDER